jgi:hypothetical protein
MQPESTLHMVLRLRGGNSGIFMSMPDGLTITLSYGPGNHSIKKLYQTVLIQYPLIKREHVKLYSNSVLLSPLKKIADYQISDSVNNHIQAVVPSFYFGSQGVVKEMKVAGYWEHNSDVLFSYRRRKPIRLNSPKTVATQKLRLPRQW